MKNSNEKLLPCPFCGSTKIRVTNPIFWYAWCSDCRGQTGANVTRQEAIDAVEFGITYVKVLNKETGEVMELFKKSNEELQKAVDRIEALPSVQPKRKNGEWVVTSEFEDCRYVKCDQCKVTQVFYHNKPLTNFCPNCGADMRGEEDGD